MASKLVVDERLLAALRDNESSPAGLVHWLGLTAEDIADFQLEYPPTEDERELFAQLLRGTSEQQQDIADEPGEPVVLEPTPAWAQRNQLDVATKVAACAVTAAPSAHYVTTLRIRSGTPAVAAFRALEQRVMELEFDGGESARVQSIRVPIGHPENGVDLSVRTVRSGVLVEISRLGTPLVGQEIEVALGTVGELETRTSDQRGRITLTVDRSLREQIELRFPVNDGVLSVLLKLI